MQTPLSQLLRGACTSSPAMTRAFQKREFVLLAEIEDLTRKAGSAKKLSIFAKMLVRALKQDCETAHIDLLTSADLEALKVSRDDCSGAALPHDKRYLILTHTTEFERLNYPLPLARTRSFSIADGAATVFRAMLAQDPDTVGTCCCYVERSVGPALGLLSCSAD